MQSKNTLLNSLSSRIGGHLLLSLSPVIVAFVSFLIAPLLSWLYPKYVLADYILIQSIINVGLSLYLIGLDHAYVREYHGVEKKEYLILKIIYFCLVFSVVTTLLILLFSDSIGEIFGFSYRYQTVLLSIVIFFASLHRLLTLKFRMEINGFLYLLSMILPKLSFLFLIVFAYYISNKEYYEIIILMCFLISYGISVSICFIFSELSRPNRDAGGYANINIGSMLSFGIPLMLSGTVYLLLFSLDKIIIKNLFGIEVLAVYGMAASLSAFGGVCSSVFSTIWSPIVYKSHHSGGDIDIYGCSEIVCIFGLLIWTFTLLLSEFVLLLIPSGYELVPKIIPFFILIHIIYMITEIPTSGINILRKSKLNLYTVLISFFIFVLLSTISIYVLSLGVEGILSSLLLSIFFNFVLRVEVSNRNWRNLPRPLLYGSCIYMLSMNLLQYYNDSYGCLIIIKTSSLILLCFVLFFKRGLITIIKNELAGEH